MENKDNTAVDEITAIAQWLQDFTDLTNRERVLLPEVIWSSLHAMKDNPELSVLQAIEEGINEWIK
jgi:hypothetical protein